MQQDSQKTLCLGSSCQTHSGKAVEHQDGSVREHSPSTTLGPRTRYSPRRVLSPWSGNHRLLKRKTTEVSLSRPGGTPPPLTPYGEGGSTRSRWTVNLQKNPLHLQGEAELPQPESSMPMLDHRKPRQFEMGTIVNKLSRSSRRHKMTSLHLILANKPRSDKFNLISF